jgi:adenylate cyclase
MTNWRFSRKRHGAGKVGRPVERTVRLATGLILFSYATSHFINHAFGIRSIGAMEAASLVLLHPWQTIAGRVLLYTSLLAHAALGLYALYRRRHLRIPPGEAWQLGLGLAIPLVLIPHAAAVAIGRSIYGFDPGYSKLLYQLWVVSWDLALPRQYLLLLVVWIHGCIGIRAWLRSKPWYQRFSSALASLATLLPVLALLGFTNAGFDLRDIVQRDPASAAHYMLAQPGTEAAANKATVDRIVDVMSFAYLGLLAGTFGFRALRNWHALRFRAVRITYPGHRVVTVPPGFSVLEASRWAGIAHASVCGGRGRCSTCRVRVIEGAERLPAPLAVERSTLDRIKAPPKVRLACQIRPTADITVEPLVHSLTDIRPGAARFDAAIEGGQELEITALFVDMRDSTRLATDRLPYDALFLFDRYIQAVTAAVRDNAGHVTSIAGDGVMSVFGVEGDAANAARNGCKAALEIWGALDSLNEELAAELGAPLRVGIGLHLGVSVVGWRPGGGSRSLQFLGDTGNIAAKLEAETKQLNCTLLVSAAALARMAALTPDIETFAVSIPGKDQPVQVVAFRQRSTLQRLIFPPA